MMQVANVNKSSGKTLQSPKSLAKPITDTVSKDIQSKIMDAQKQRQGLSFQTELTSEEKDSIRRKIQQEISDLKRELRQREAEEKQKLQEEEKAAERKTQQQEAASQEAVKEQQRKTHPAQNTNEPQQKTQSAQNAKETQQKYQNTQSAQNAKEPQQKYQNTLGTKQQQDNIPDSGARRETNASTTDGEVREILPGGMHKIISNNSNIQQFRIIRNTAAQTDASVRIQEAEMNSDSVRGADLESHKKELQQSLLKETKRRETMQGFMFGESQKTSPSAAGIKNHFFRGSETNSLYGSNGALFKNNFQSIQLDIRQ